MSFAAQKMIFWRLILNEAGKFTKRIKIKIRSIRKNTSDRLPNCIGISMHTCRNTVC